MNETNYPDTMAAAEHPSAPKLGFWGALRQVALNSLMGLTIWFLLTWAYQPGGTILAAAIFAAVVCAGVVSCVRFTKRERSRQQMMGQASLTEARR